MRLSNEGAEEFGWVCIGNPMDMCPLQVADLVAYETRCAQRDRPNRRYPFRLLIGAAEKAGGRFPLSFGWL